MPRPSHVAVVGAGITGALVAQRLLQEGVRVTVLEAKEKGAGSSSRSAACIRQQFSTPATVQAMIYSVRRYRRFAEDFGCEPGTRVLVQNGYLFLYERPDLADDADLASRHWEIARQNAEMQRAHGLDDVLVLSPGELHERFPHVDHRRLAGATFCPSDGFLHADVIYQEGFRRVLELGGVLRQNCAVLGAEPKEDGPIRRLLTSDGDALEADVVVNATNAWGPRLSRTLGGSDLAVSPVKRYLYFLHRGETLGPEELPRWPMTITPSRAYCRPENAEQLLGGWAHPARPQPDFDWSDQDAVEPGFFHKSGLDNYGFKLWLRLAESIPAVGDFAGIEATTAGFYAMTPDHNPWFGFDPRRPNLLHAVGFSGHGAMLGPFTAAAISAMAMAGHDLREIELDGRPVDLSALLLGRRHREPEGMVI